MYQSRLTSDLRFPGNNVRDLRFPGNQVPFVVICSVNKLKYLLGSSLFALCVRQVLLRFWHAWLLRGLQVIFWCWHAWLLRGPRVLFWSYCCCCCCSLSCLAEQVRPPEEKQTVIIIIKKCRQCKAEREWYTPNQSEDWEKGKIV